MVAIGFTIQPAGQIALIEIYPPPHVPNFDSPQAVPAITHPQNGYPGQLPNGWFAFIQPDDQINLGQILS